MNVRTLPPDWIVRITDQEAAATCIPYSRANLICPPLEWEGRSGTLFGTPVGCSIIPLVPPLSHGASYRIADVRAEIRYLLAPLALHVRWHDREGPIRDFVLRTNEWHLGAMDVLIEEWGVPRPHRSVHAGTIPLREFVTVGRQIAEIIADGYSWDAICDVTGTPGAKGKTVSKPSDAGRSRDADNEMSN